ncbi:MAG: hypothetical protein AB8E82_16040 [Aureispira sp.]
MKFLFTLFSVLFLYQTMAAQVVPGYMGKRHFLEIGPSIGFNSFQEAEPSFFDVLAFKPTLSYSYILSRKTNINAGYQYSSLKVRSRLDDDKYNNYRVFAQNFNVGLDIYPVKKKPYMLAPLGTFIRVGLHTFHTHQALLTPNTTNYNPTNIAHITFGAELGIGFRLVMGNQFLISADIHSIILMPTAIVISGEDELNDLKDYNYQTSLLGALQLRHFIEWRVALGVFLQ